MGDVESLMLIGAMAFVWLIVRAVERLPKVDDTDYSAIREASKEARRQELEARLSEEPLDAFDIWYMEEFEIVEGKRG